jgi:PPOX class probable FMN-dependent enzyme
VEFSDRITDLASLRELYREPSELVANKAFDVIDETTAAYIDRCPFVIISTSNGGDSMDVSPRGGPPGFLRRLDDRHIAIPDLNGNNRLDTLENIVAHPFVGLLLVMPGKDETVRINGPARVTTDAAILDGFTVELRRPKTAIVVEVAELYSHCAKSFRRGKVWQPESWADLADSPDLADIVGTQFSMESSGLRTALEGSYDHDLTLD